MSDALAPIEIRSEQVHQLYEELCAIRGLLTPHELPWFRPLHFNGAEGIVEKREDRGPSALSYGVYNPVEAKVYLGLFGATPSRAGGGFPVPAESVLILPLDVPAQIGVGVDAGELGANAATIYVMRFKAPQPFFLGAI